MFTSCADQEKEPKCSGLHAVSTDDAKAGSVHQLQKRDNAAAVYLQKAGLSPLSLSKLVSSSSQFHTHFLAASLCDKNGLRVPRMPEWGAKFIRRSGGIPHAVLEKLGSNSFSKRRPQHSAAFLGYLQKRYEAQECLNFRLVVGPVKNIQLCGEEQQPDLAERLMFLQLAKLAETIAALYPYGVKVQMVPDDRRGRAANCWPAFYSKIYVAGLRRMAEDLGLTPWLHVEDGQSHLYALYEVEKYFGAAEEGVLHSQDFEKNLEIACVKAKQNFFAYADIGRSESTLRDSALRYLVSHKAEILSGMWSPEDAFPLIYANHPDNYQLYTLGQGLTKLPWQLYLPFSAFSDAPAMDS